VTVNINIDIEYLVGQSLFNSMLIFCQAVDVILYFFNLLLVIWGCRC